MPITDTMLSGCCLRQIKAHLVFGKTTKFVGFCADCRNIILEYNPKTQEEKLVGTLATAEQLADKRHQVKASLASHKWMRRV